jgi:hypothetical protein
LVGFNTSTNRTQPPPLPPPSGSNSSNGSTQQGGFATEAASAAFGEYSVGGHQRARNSFYSEAHDGFAEVDAQLAAGAGAAFEVNQAGDPDSLYNTVDGASPAAATTTPPTPTPTHALRLASPQDGEAPAIQAVHRTANEEGEPLRPLPAHHTYTNSNLNPTTASSTVNSAAAAGGGGGGSMSTVGVAEDAEAFYATPDPLHHTAAPTHNGQPDGHTRNNNGHLSNNSRPDPDLESFYNTNVGGGGGGDEGMLVGRASVGVWLLVMAGVACRRPTIWCA